VDGPVRPERPRTSAQRAGDAAEGLVAAQLLEAGWTILARNIHVGRRELDLVAIDPGPPRALVIVEVRWRARRDYGLAEETVDHRKRMRIRQAAYALLRDDDATHALPGQGGDWQRLPLRFDLIVVEPPTAGGAARVRHHRAAF
jgi:putative endonuclease